jgi:hypothetical protein
MFAAVRAIKIKDINQIAATTRHARRQDATSMARVREGTSWQNNPAFSHYSDDPTDTFAAFKNFKKQTGAKERANAPLALHLLAIVSPEFLAEAGDIHDRENQNVKKLIETAQAWAEETFGKGSLLTSRMDLDERGSAVVDLVVCPVRDSRGKATISTNKALAEIQEAHGDLTEYGALNSSWAKFAQANLDSRLKRGLSKDETGAVHLTPEQFGKVKDEVKAQATEYYRAKLPEVFQKAADQMKAQAVEQLGEIVDLIGKGHLIDVARPDERPNFQSYPELKGDLQPQFADVSHAPAFIERFKTLWRAALAPLSRWVIDTMTKENLTARQVYEHIGANNTEPSSEH